MKKKEDFCKKKLRRLLPCCSLLDLLRVSLVTWLSALPCSSSNKGQLQESSHQAFILQWQHTPPPSVL
ncbi:hypothetical protein ATANTOWER_020910 [Ataeniobius toweri]|uniref:Uncharacterized protein n=1 Tax=Ataeniobius toweri TaxID=208326 RepID=A0ABU7B198_9TELE|nr:hypothetical protein [Ataeniobius toweri]